ncbi:AraC family transcriptional regulator [Paucibacter sp. B2R-40]|uniref:AraC family transcriptional regulator n=1 Tax=Paucibacter sp. B2R-40 TaxID=2893554 RepID=UPI0021E4BD73|nr:AraC family transcriptional regulator [Paucibacter sp. B2R-40]MCV2355696.1 AraC family transcriptional regulator [Paucibacter sp. B2R-40]
MPEVPARLPALTLRLQLQGLATLGLDVACLHARLGPLPQAPDALVPVQAYLDMWDEAERLYGQPGLPSALAHAIPFGAFGALDYLVGSADTVAGCCESAMLHFAMVSVDTALEIDLLGDGAHALRVRALTPLPEQALEFTIAALFSRLRYVSGGGFKPQLLGLPLARPTNDEVRSRLYGLAPAYGHPCAEMLIDAATWQLPTHSADAFLHATLKGMAAQLQLAQAGDSTLERALRVRLRDALAQGRADAARMAELLGVSERTLQRRLADIGRSFSDVVEEFRREEAARLLATPGLPLVEVASRLGYAEQTSFTRAFRRWTGITPGAWRTGQRV